MTKTFRTDRNIRKAQPSPNEIESVAIIIQEELPAFAELGQQDEYCRLQAQRLEGILIDTLPGATYDQLLAAMLLRKASHFRVAHGQ